MGEDGSLIWPQRSCILLCSEELSRPVAKGSLKAAIRYWSANGAIILFEGSATSLNRLGREIVSVDEPKE